MTKKANNKKKTALAWTITLISLVTIFSILTTLFLQPTCRINTQTTLNQSPKKSSIPTRLTDLNETTNRMEASNSYINYSLAPNNPTPISLDDPKSSTNKQPDPNQLFYSFLHNINHDQTAASTATPLTSDTHANETQSLNSNNLNNNDPSAPILTVPTPLDPLNFTTYMYGGNSDQHSNQGQLFSFPNNTDQGKLAGTDAITFGNYVIQKMDFDAEFVTPEINALGFDEMVIFAATDIATYKGIEFGIRLDLGNGYIYGYIQEPNGNYGKVNFQMWKLMLNDGIMHHYTLIMLGSGVSFCIDGSNYGYLNFISKTNYSNLNFSILSGRS